MIRFLITQCLAILFLLGAGSSVLLTQKTADPFAWPALRQEHKPWAYWWWLGNAVDTNNLTALLEKYRAANFGGMHIIPIYGVRGEEKKFIDYLSPRWMEMLAHTVGECHRLGFGVDMTLGTGWNFGGPEVSPEDAPTKVVAQTYALRGGETLTNLIRFNDEVDKQPLRPIALMAYSSGGEARDVSALLEPGGKLNWKLAGDDWTIYALFESKIGGAVVERASPGGQGHMCNPFSGRAITNYLAWFDRAFAQMPAVKARAVYHDSYEYHHSTWCDDLLEQFQRRRGYDLRTQLPALFGEGSDDLVGRVRCDYRETIADLHLEEYITPWAEWARGRGMRTRNQAHGAPASILDVYAATDIPETEIFHSSRFDIPGLRQDAYDFDRPTAAMMRFASSAAHIGGRNLVASETCTWLTEHFQETLALAKPELDQLFVNGINHIFYHGVSYSPTNAEWPGWLFYASAHFGPAGALWRDLPAMNLYVARCQAILQGGTPDNDVLLYYPVYDLWQRPKGLNQNFGDLVQPTQVHYVGLWLNGTPFHKLATELTASGRGADYVSDRFLKKSTIKEGRVAVGSQSYEAIVIPKCQYMPPATLRRIIELAESGATVIFDQATPSRVPGLGGREAREQERQQLLARLQWGDFASGPVQVAKVGQGRVFKTDNVIALLNQLKVRREPVVETGLQFIRRKHDAGHHYFLASLGNHRVNGWVELGVPAKSVVVMNPMTGATGVAAIGKGGGGNARVYLQVEPGQSLILRTFDAKKVEGPQWKNLQPAGKPTEMVGDWQVKFVQGGPVLPKNYVTNRLVSWTAFPDEETKRFGGTARYTLRFTLPEAKADDWQLDLGNVCESARVKVNGRDAGVLFSVPFRTRIGEFLRPGANELEIEVTNLDANRIRDLDRRKVPWKKFYDINYVSIKYRPFNSADWPLTDSGLLGPVRLTPLAIVKTR